MITFQTSRGPILRSATFLLIAVNVIVYVILQAGGNLALAILAQTGELFYRGFYWQPFSALFVHFDITHIFFNMIALFYFGRLNEMNFPVSQYLAIYFGAGLFGNLASLFIIAPNIPTGGASGAIFGLLGSYVSIERKAGNVAMGLVYAFLIFVQSSGPGVNIFAHLFGLAGGLMLGLLFTTFARGRVRP